jgi:uncharacterized protein (UPF0147 family)
MPKYSPESRDKLKRKVKDFDSEARDHIRHMSSIVQNDAGVIAGVSRNIRPAGTIEAAKAIKEALQRSGNEVKKEYGRSKSTLEDIISKEGSKLESELKERRKDSTSNYTELTKASGSIKETHAARSKIDQVRQVAQKDTYTLDSLRNTVHRVIQKTSQHHRELDYKIANTLQFSGSSANTEYMIQGLKANQAAMEKERHKSIFAPWEVKIIPREEQDHQLCPRAKKEIEKAKAAKEELEAKLKANQFIQSEKQIHISDEISKKDNRNYGRSSVMPGEQSNLYKQKDTYE